MSILFPPVGSPRTGFSSFFLVQGGLLVLLGILIILFPALLRVMVATFFILIGGLVLGFGLTLRGVERSLGRSDGNVIDL